MTRRNESLGDYRSHRQTDTGLAIRADNGRAFVTVYSDTVIRIEVCRHDDPPEPVSYAVTAEPVTGGFEVDPEEDRIILRTRKIRLEIEKEPVRFRFYTPDGILINADDPAFGASWIGEEITGYKSLQPGERFIGMGEKQGDLDRAGWACTNWNTDYYAYPVDERDMPLYATFPFYIGIHGGLVYGIFMDNPHRSRFNFGASNNRFSYFSADGGTLNYYFIHDSGVREILAAYTHLTGRMSLPPLWSLGYQQCRYSYYPHQKVINIARIFREKEIPADVIYLDIHYMDRYKVFTWDEERFPSPEKLITALRDEGFHVVVIVDPGIKIEPGYPYYEEGKEKDLFLKYPDGEPYSGQVWPGWCHFPDFTRPETRDWWGSSLETYLSIGVEGIWNDMNEPATWGQQVPNLVEFDWEGHGATHQKARNVYGMQMARSSYEGTRRLMKNRRPFILTRSAYAGAQRYSAIWTGDNVASDEHLMAGVLLLSNLGLTGMAFTACDISGFWGDSSPALFARWITVGAFSPFMRTHSMVESRDAEPWSYGETVEEISRNYIQFRYRLLPYLYSTFYEATQNGMPVVRTLAIDHPHDPQVYDKRYQYQYLFGDSILVAPAESTKEITKVYLPPGRWYDFYTGRLEEGGREVYAESPVARLPLFVRAGAVIPMQTVRNHTEEQITGPLQVHVYAGGDASSSFLYYEDDGETFDYEQGQFFRRRIRLTDHELFFEAAEGDYFSAYEEIQLWFHGYCFHEKDRVTMNGEKTALASATFRLCAPVFAADPLGIPYDPYGAVELPTAVFPNLRDSIRVTWD